MERQNQILILPILTLYKLFGIIKINKRDNKRISMIKKSFLIILILVLFFSFFQDIFFFQKVPVAQADSYWNPNTGLLPSCAASTSTRKCGICDVFQLIVNVINFLLFRIVPPLAILMFVVGGAAFLFSAGNPALLSTGKKIIISVIIGMVIAYGSYLIVGVVIKTLGPADWVTTGLGYGHWWEDGVFHINCAPTSH